MPPYVGAQRAVCRSVFDHWKTGKCLVGFGEDNIRLNSLNGASKHEERPRAADEMPMRDWVLMVVTAGRGWKERTGEEERHTCLQKVEEKTWY